MIIENKKKERKQVIIMSEKRVFKKDYLGELKVLAEDAGREDLVDFCEKEIEKLTNRKTSQTKNQKEFPNFQRISKTHFITFINHIKKEKNMIIRII